MFRLFNTMDAPLFVTFDDIQLIQIVQEVLDAEGSSTLVVDYHWKQIERAALKLAEDSEEKIKLRLAGEVGSCLEEHCQLAPATVSCHLENGPSVSAPVR